MNCPACSTRMRLYEKSGVEVDVCPSCKGVWLDRGELEKILEAESRHVAPYADPLDYGPGHNHCEDQRGTRYGRGYSEHRGGENHHGEHGHGDRSGQTGRRRSFLSELLGGLGGDD